MKLTGKKELGILGVLLMTAGIYSLGYQVPRTDFALLFGIYLGLFALMAFFYGLARSATSVRTVFIFGLILRILLLPSFPTWSEDFARFLWDGKLLQLGFNPYLHTPNQWAQLYSEYFSAYLAELLSQMNSPDYFSVYPPLNQFFFWLIAEIGGDSLIQNLIAIRILLIGGEVGVFFLMSSLLKKFRMEKRAILLYWLNPFVILEISGNLHFEGLVLLALLLVLCFSLKNRFYTAGAFWAVAIGLKLLPLILAPSFWNAQSKKWAFWIGASLVGVFLFTPLLWDQSWQNFAQSLSLYQGKFEFNASIYYLARTVGYWVEGYNTIAVLTKGLSFLTLVLILWISWKNNSSKVENWVELWIGIYLIYLLLQPVIHPWYLIPGLGLSILRGKVGFLIWSFAVIFSYQAYGNENYVERPTFLALEYSLLALALLYDYRSQYFNFLIHLWKK